MTRHLISRHLLIQLSKWRIKPSLSRLSVIELYISARIGLTNIMQTFLCDNPLHIYHTKNSHTNKIAAIIQNEDFYVARANIDN